LDSENLRAAQQDFFFLLREARRIVTYSNPTATVPYSGMTNGQFNHVVCTQWANMSNGAPALHRLRTTIPSTSFDPIAAAYVKDIFSKFPTPNGATRAILQRSATLANAFNFAKTW